MPVSAVVYIVVRMEEIGWELREETTKEREKGKKS